MFDYCWEYVAYSNPEDDSEIIWRELDRSCGFSEGGASKCYYEIFCYMRGKPLEFDV